MVKRRPPRIKPGRRDPTRTTLLRNSFTVALRKQYATLAKDCKWWFTSEQWMPRDERLTGNALSDWSLRPKGGILAAFMRWLNKRLKSLDIELTADGFIQRSYERGATNGLEATVSPQNATDLKKGGWLGRLFRARTTVDRLKILRTQAKQHITKLSEKIKSQVIDIVTEGMIGGEHPNKIATEISKKVTSVAKVDARRIARTEIIRAHAEGTLDSMESLGVEEVGVLVEWSTSGDGKVCPLCKPLESVVLPIQHAHGMFPRHPNCRCSPIPSFKKLQKDAIVSAVRKSIEAGKSKGTWPGPAITAYLNS